MSKPQIVKSSSFSSEENPHQHSISDKPLSIDYASNSEYHQVELGPIKESVDLMNPNHTYFYLYPCRKGNESFESIIVYLTLELILAHFYYRTIWIIQACLITPGYAILYFMGAYFPLLFCIYKVFYINDAFYGNQSNPIYFIYTCTQLSFVYGVAWSLPSIYNSSFNSVFSFFIFLILSKSLSSIFELITLLCWKIWKVKWLSWVLELLVLGIYIACLVIHVKDSTNVYLLYGVWSGGIVLDALILFYKQWTWDHDTFLKDKPKDSFQSHVSTSTRLSLSIFYIFCIGMGNLFQEKIGVGMPDLFVSVNYNVWCFLVGLLGLLILYLFCRCYLGISPSKSVDIKIWKIVREWLHICLLATSLILIAGLRISLKSLWNQISLNGTKNLFTQFNLQSSAVHYSIWPSLPVPISSPASGYLSQWVLNQTFVINRPPSAIFYESALSGSSKIDTVNAHPDILIGCASGLALILMTLLQIIGQWNERINLLQKHILLIHIYRIVLAIVFIGLAFALDMFILWKLIIICLGLLVLVLLQNYSIFLHASKQ